MLSYTLREGGKIQEDPKWGNSSHHIPSSDRCPAGLQAIATSEKLSPVLLLSVDLQGTEHGLGQLGLAVLAVFLSQPFAPQPPTSNLLAAGVEQETETALPLCKHCSAIAKKLVWHQNRFCHKSHSNIRVAVTKANSTPARASTMQDDIVFLDKFGLTRFTLCWTWAQEL